MELTEKAAEIVAQVNRVVLGKERETREVMLTFLAGGHVLLEDIPGVGKTTMALAFSRAMDLDCRRVQFTPDVMPSDLTGFSIYRRDEGRFVFQPGSVFCNLLLADEINRTSPKTQSALLEVMEEGRVTVEGVTRDAPDPFFVIATQNPTGSAGTQPLPDTQLDRFMASLSLGYPDYAHELEMAKTAGEHGRADSVRAVAVREDLLAMRHAVHGVFVHDDVYAYLLQLVVATRKDSRLLRGAGPRATIALVKLSKSAAWLDGRDYVTPNDVREQYPFAVSHRLTLNTGAKMEGISREKLVAELADSVKKPGLGGKRK